MRVPRLVRLVGLGVMLGLCVTARGGTEDSWLPAQDGWKWTYDIHKVARVGGIVSAKKRGTATCVCRGLEKIDGVETAVLEWSGEGEDAPSLKIWVRATDTTVTVARASHHELLVVPADAKVKKSLEVEVTGDKKKVAVESETLSTEDEVTTPAGKWKCLKVAATCTFGSVSVKRTVWYAKGVGVVKIVKESTVGGVSAERELVLTRFDKGEKPKKDEPEAPK